MDTTSYLKAHDRIDLLLDTSPYAGGTTTCLGLWMGVPTLTVPGPTLPSRAGAAILERVGLMEFIASDAGDFVARAADFADPSARERLAAVRAGLRDRDFRGRRADGLAALVRGSAAGSAAGSPTLPLTAVWAGVDRASPPRGMGLARGGARLLRRERDRNANVPCNDRRAGGLRGERRDRSAGRVPPGT
jgi:hypothetical protein